MWKERIANERQAQGYMERVRGGGVVLGLDCMERLAAKMGNPQDSLQFVHIAGTNGKGSVLAFVSTVAKRAGYRTGRYFSPAVCSELERWQVNGRPISKADWVRGLEAVRAAAEEIEAEGGRYPTPFEVETALAFWYFREKKCDIAVLETGMGGLTDATNIVSTTAVAVLTSIGMDHMEALGTTLDEIALQKAGIVKRGCRVVSAQQAWPVMRVIEETCREYGAPLRAFDRSGLRGIRFGIERQRFSYNGYEKLAIGLAGIYQIENAALALEVIGALRECGYRITDDAVRKGLLETEWAGRFSVLSKRPYFIIDGAHNVDAVQKLKESVLFYFTNKKIITIMGMLQDKEYEKAAALTAPLAAQVITVTPPGSKRALPAYELAGAVKRYNPNVTAADSLQEAVEMSYLLADRESVIIAFGSLSYIGEVAEIVANRRQIRRDAHGRSEKD